MKRFLFIEEWRLLGLVFLFGMMACTTAPAPTPTMVPATTTAVATNSATPSEPTAVATVLYTYEIIDTYPHDAEAFTQGLVWEDGKLYEGTGLNGRSSLRRVDLESGTVEEIIILPDQYFGEGVTIFDDRIYQITWQAREAFVYDQETFELLDTFTYSTEGWGITHDGEQLIMSDGSDIIYFRNPDTFAEIGRIQVRDGNGPVVRINELEYINGRIYGNIWQTDQIAQIDPLTGQVTGWLDLAGILSATDRQNLTNPGNAVLNGIAYDAENDRLFVTGKLWPKLFEIELVSVE